MKNLTLIILGKNNKIIDEKNIEMIFCDGKDIQSIIKKAKGNYITFLKEDDQINKDYLQLILKESENDFDCSFINYNIMYDYKNKIKISTNIQELSKNKPFYGEYLWSFIFKRTKLLEILEITNKIDFDKAVEEKFVKTRAINNLIYFHNPKGKQYIKGLQYTDTKKDEYYKNLIYVGNGCMGIFNGYISWLNNIGRCFSKKFDITVLYDEIHPKTLKIFSQYFKCIKRENNTNYLCDSLSVTYSTYYYPKNIFTLDQNYLFIHGNMSDYPNTRVYYDDLFSHYVAVSEIAAKKAVGYFPTKNIEHILNPFKLDKNLLKPHLKLTSTYRYATVKRPERVELMAKILDELEIPYTWNLFTDTKENTNVNGLIYRSRVTNPIPYVEDSDYFVLLSDSEAMPYSILESLAVNTKVVVTPLDAYKELGLKNNENCIIIPFEYFNPENKEKLVKIIKKMYKEKEKKVKYKIDESLWKGYNDVFIK